MLADTVRSLDVILLHAPHINAYASLGRHRTEQAALKKVFAPRTRMITSMNSNRLFLDRPLPSDSRFASVALASAGPEDLQ